MKNNEFTCLFDEKYREAYRKENTGPTNPNHSFDTTDTNSGYKQPQPTIKEDGSSDTQITPQTPLPEVFGHSVMEYINALLPNGVAEGSRHREALKLADDLIIMFDGNKDKANQVLVALPWVQDVIKERGAEEISRIMDSAQKHFQKKEEENLYSPQPSKRMRKVIERVTNKSFRMLTAENNEQNGVVIDPHEAIMRFVESCGLEIRKLFRNFLLLQLLCHGQKLKHYVAYMFAGGALAMTLMTRCWYRFYPCPGKKSRMNCIMELIGPPGNGKRFLVDLFRIMMEPVKKSDEAQIAALNKWNQEQNTKGANKDKSARPKGLFRCLPSETSAASIREAEMNAKETIDGEEWPLHVFHFDSELDNTIRQMKKGYMDFATLYLKAFHNEPHGSFLKTTSSQVGEYDVHLNCAYSGTEFALNKQVNVENYSTGLYGRLTLVLMAYSNFEMMEKTEYTEKDKKCEDLLREWAYKLDKTKGEIPVKMLSDRLYEWTANRMADAKEDDSKVDEDLLKRCAWHAINYAIPFIVTRHWDEMVEDNGYMKAGPNFKVDKTDWRLCQLIANAQFTFQRYFIGPIAEKFYEQKAFNDSTNYHPQTRTKQAYMKLNDIFDLQEVMNCYGYSSIGGACSRLKRLQDNGMAEKIRSGENKGKYRKLA